MNLWPLDASKTYFSTMNGSVVLQAVLYFPHSRVEIGLDTKMPSLNSTWYSSNLTLWLHRDDGLHQYFYIGRANISKPLVNFFRFWCCQFVSNLEQFLTPRSFVFSFVNLFFFPCKSVCFSM